MLQSCNSCFQEENRLGEIRMLLAAKQRERAEHRHALAMKEVSVHPVWVGLDNHADSF